MKRQFIFVVLLVVFCSLSVLSQTNSVSINVKLTANSSDPILKTLLYKSLSDELSLITDLKLREKGYGYWLDVVATEVKTSKGVSMGYALSMTITSTRNCKPLGADPNSNDISIYDDLVFHQIVLTDKANLNRTSKQIVEGFNTAIEPFRKLLKSLKD